MTTKEFLTKAAQDKTLGDALIKDVEAGMTGADLGKKYGFTYDEAEFKALADAAANTGDTLSLDDMENVSGGVVITTSLVIGGILAFLGAGAVTAGAMYATDNDKIEEANARVQEWNDAHQQ